jgi:hypothetical protein
VLSWNIVRRKPRAVLAWQPPAAAPAAPAVAFHPWSIVRRKPRVVMTWCPPPAQSAAAPAVAVRWSMPLVRVPSRRERRGHARLVGSVPAAAAVPPLVALQVRRKPRVVVAWVKRG